MNTNFTGGDTAFHFGSLPAFTTSLIEPVDHYQLTERAIKYAILFIGLTFFSFFLFESLTSLRLHPMQYLLVGAALVLFYLMLLAFSEHIGFTLAYLLASLSCSLLIAIYLSAVLGGWLRGITVCLRLIIVVRHFVRIVTIRGQRTVVRGRITVCCLDGGNVIDAAFRLVPSC